MGQDINQESKNQFLSTIEKAMTLLNHVGHVTDFNNLSNVSYMKASELHGFLFSSFDSGITSEDWIQAGVTVGNLEELTLYFQWYARLHVAGVHDHEGRSICADCLPEDQWGYALSLHGRGGGQFKVIPRGKTGESFYCDACRNQIQDRKW